MFDGMSDESPPPQLRLRPRKRDDEVAPAPPPSPVILPSDQAAVSPSVSDVAPSGDPAPGRFRLKPKLSLDADAPTITPEAPAIAPLLTSDDDGTSVPRFKLKSTTPSLGDPTVGSIPEENSIPAAFIAPADATGGSTETGPLPASEDPAALLIIPGVEPPAVQAPEPAPVVEAVAVPPAPIAPPVGKVKAAKPKVAPPAPRKLILALLVLLLVGGGAGGYFYVMQEDAPPPIAIKRATPPVVKPAAEAPVAATPETVEPLPPPPVAVAIEPLLTGPESALTAPTAVSKPAKAAPVPVMTPAFRLWIDGVRINGVAISAGSAPRVIINGRLVRPGDTIDNAEGIVFESLDAENKQVMFRNRAGMVAGKPY